MGRHPDGIIRRKIGRPTLIREAVTVIRVLKRT